MNIISLILLVLVLLFLGGFAEAEVKPQVINVPGSVDLVYFGPQVREPPLAPLEKIRVNNRFFYIYPGVVVPSIQSAFLLDNTIIQTGETVLDIGSGSGIQAIFAAQKAKHVVATDISFNAVDNTRFNVMGHNLSERIDVRQGDLFAPIRKDEKFDVIIFNIDYPYDQNTQGLWKVHERFFKEVKNYLTPGGRIYYQAGYISNIPKIYTMVFENKLKIMKMNMYAALEHYREPIFFLIIPDPLRPDLPM